MRRRLVLLFGGMLLLASMWVPVGTLVERLSPENDPALLRKQGIALAMDLEATRVELIAAAAAVAAAHPGPQILAYVAKEAKAYTDSLLPAMRMLGIQGDDGVPAWLVPCYESTQPALQAAGTVFDAAAEIAALDERSKQRLDDAANGLGEMAERLRYLAGTGVSQGQSATGGVGGINDPLAYCQRIEAISRSLQDLGAT